MKRLFTKHNISKSPTKPCKMIEKHEVPKGEMEPILKRNVHVDKREWRKNKTNKTKKPKHWDSLCLQFHLGVLGDYDLGMTPADGGFVLGPSRGVMMVRVASIFLHELKRWQTSPYSYSSDIE